MNNMPSYKALLPLTFIASLFIAGMAHAEQPARKHHHQLQGSYTRQVQQTDTGNGFIRNTTTTNTAGETATRNTTVVNDKENGTRTRTVTGTTFKGETYSGESVTHRTDTGYTREAVHVGTDGKVVNRSVNAEVDKSAGTMTKTISRTPEGGETSTKTIVKTVQKSE